MFGQLNAQHDDDETNREYAQAANQHCTLSFIVTLLTHKLYITAHKTPRTPLTQPSFQLPAHPTLLSTATPHCHNYSNCPPTLKSSATLHDQRACALIQARPTCTVVVTHTKESKRGEGNSLSFECVLATLKPHCLAPQNLQVQTANYYVTCRFFLLLSSC